MINDNIKFVISVHLFYSHKSRFFKNVLFLFQIHAIKGESTFIISNISLSKKFLFKINVDMIIHFYFEMIHSTKS